MKLQPRQERVELWFSAELDCTTAKQAGLRIEGGGPHQSKTMLLQELQALLAQRDADWRGAVVSENLFGKPSTRARRAAYKSLAALYSLDGNVAVFATLKHLWDADPGGRQMLAVLCALARDPTLRDCAAPVLDAALGEPVHAPAIAAAFEAAHPGRLGLNSIASLSRNAASTWTQAGFLAGKIRKRRVRPLATPAAAAYAAMLAELAGYTGERLISSRWLDVTDVSVENRLGLLRRAEGLGFARVRRAGDVLEIEAVRPLTKTLGIAHNGSR